MTPAQKAYRYMATEAETVRRLLKTDISEPTAYRMMLAAKAQAMQFLQAGDDIEVTVRRGTVGFAVMEGVRRG
jgi:hypothetical protein